LWPVENAGWRLLFDGQTAAGWRGFRAEGFPETGWEITDGTLHHRPGEGGGDLVTEAQFQDFELDFEWKVAPGANSGVIYRVSEEHPNTWHTGPEYQVLDDAGHRDGQNPLTSAGSNYGLHPAPRGAVRPAGEWNTGRILVRGSHVEHWLNGTKTAEYEFGSDDWKARVAGSKFVEWPAYGQSARGHIGLQDHGDMVWYRSVKIRPLR
jgi:hypothetical protein